MRKRTVKIISIVIAALFLLGIITPLGYFYLFS